MMAGQPNKTAENAEGRREDTGKFLCVSLRSLRLILALPIIFAAFDQVAIPQHSTDRNWPPAIPTPKGNPTSPEKIALGKQLFFDPRLSGNNKMSCATCHLPEKAFGDGLARSKGNDGKDLSRNTQTVLNTAFLKKLFWDGRASSLEEQTLGPIQSPVEMNQDLGKLEKELNAVPGYVTEFRKVFQTRVTRDGIAKALAAFQRTLVTGPSPYDRYRAGDVKALTPSAKRGMQLFFGEADCARCHKGPMFTDEKLYRLGASFEDKGLGAITKKAEDDYKFRTPPLRNVAQTGPYMHNGSLKSLSEVVTFYYRNIPVIAPGGLQMDVQPFVDGSLTEVGDLVAFLEALSGEMPKVKAPVLP